jgi:acetyl esterase
MKFQCRITVALAALSLLFGASVMAKEKPVLEPKTQAFLNDLQAKGVKPINKMSYEEARQNLIDLQSKNVSLPAADVEDRDLKTGENETLSVRIYRPQGVKGDLPVVMYFHGGGWVLGSEKTHERLLRDLASKSRLAFVLVKYKLAPEGQFPLLTEQAYAATKYIAEHGASLHLDGTHLAVAGDSAGGNMATVVTLLAKQRKAPQIRYQALFYPVTDASFDTPSYKVYGQGPWLTKAEMQWFWNAYAPKKADRQRITASPLRATEQDLAGLPPALIITAENDVLRDEGEAYADKLTSAGVPVVAVRMQQTIHDFMMLNALADTPAAKNAVWLAATNLTAALTDHPLQLSQR